MFAELAQRGLDASFTTDFSTSGNFVRVPVKGRNYWYFEETQPSKKRKYVGPASDPEIADRVAAFTAIKEDLRARRDRKSDGLGKSVSGRVDMGVGRSMQKKKKNT